MLIVVLDEEEREYAEGLATNEELRAQEHMLNRKAEQFRLQLETLNQSITKESNCNTAFDCFVLLRFVFLVLAQKERMREAANKRIHHLVGLYQEHLGLYVEPLDAEVTTFTFTNIDPDAWSRKFTFTIQVVGDGYEIYRVDPQLPNNLATDLSSQLNEDKDFFGFLRKIRKAFKALARPPTEHTISQQQQSRP